MSTSKKLNDSSVSAMAPTDTTALVASDPSSGKVGKVSAGALKTYIGAPCLAKVTIPAQSKTVFIIPSAAYMSFTATTTIGGGMASGMFTAYGKEKMRSFLNAKRGDSRAVKAYAASNAIGLVLENNDTMSRPMTVNLVTSAKITAEEYSEATHGSLEELEWGG